MMSDNFSLPKHKKLEKQRDNIITMTIKSDGDRGGFAFFRRKIKVESFGVVQYRKGSKGHLELTGKIVG